MKENNGHAFRLRQAKRMMWLGGSMFVCSLVVWYTVHSSSTGGGGGSIIGSGGGSRLLRDMAAAPRNFVANSGNNGEGTAAQEFRRKLSQQFEDETEVELLEKVLAGELNLMDLYVVEEDLDRSPSNTYNGVYGMFCNINFEIHKRDPSAVPMFRDLIAHSLDCTEKDPVYLDIKKVAMLATETYSSNILNLTAVVFHESRCGSTLVANNLIAMNPTQHRVYSESTPAIKAYNVCGGDSFSKCSQNQAVQVFQDVVKVMSITTVDSEETSVFFKFQSSTTKYLPTFQQAFPTTPWMFIYRDPVQVMMSHFKDSNDLSKAICTRTRKHPPADVRQIAENHDNWSPSTLKYENYCAIHLAAITDAAVRALQTNPMGIPINYDQLPTILWEQVLPKQILGRELTTSEITNMERISTQYSKGRGGRHGEFVEDSEKKVAQASEEIKAAAEEYLQESFERLSNYQGPMMEGLLK